MTTFQAIGILAIFAVCVVLMMARKLPTILALPIMAVGIALVAGIPLSPAIRSSSPSPETYWKAVRCE